MHIPKRCALPHQVGQNEQAIRTERNGLGLLLHRIVGTEARDNFLGCHFELGKIVAQITKGLPAAGGGGNRGKYLARVGHVGAIDHRVEDQLRVFVDDADDAACAQVDLDVASVYCAASDPTGVTINRTRRDRNARNQARFFGGRLPW